MQTRAARRSHRGRGFPIVAVAVAVAVAAFLLACVQSTAFLPSTSTDVVIRVVDGVVTLEPSTVTSGQVRFVVEGSAGKADTTIFEFVARGLGPCPPCTEPEPLLGGDIERLRADSAPQGLGSDSGWGAGVTLTLRVGTYAFMVPGPMGAQPGIPPASVTPLTVTP